MKKQEKMEVLVGCIEKKLMCDCSFEGENYSVSLYPAAVNEKFVLGHEESDFQLNGCCIRRFSDLKKVRQCGEKFNEICRMLGVTGDLARPYVDISDWESVFESLTRLDIFVEIEDTDGDTFTIGRIEKYGRKSVSVRYFDTEGVWAESRRKIRYADISVLKWGTRYGNGWKQYFEMTQASEQKRDTSEEDQK
ncbi:MAG: hypothetical protein Q4A66_13425 [Eubacteriales bacterium]|nr:hypothetical protein [Eubacteriales bacterium]